MKLHVLALTLTVFACNTKGERKPSPPATDETIESVDPSGTAGDPLAEKRAEMMERRARAASIAIQEETEAEAEVRAKSEAERAAAQAEQAENQARQAEQADRMEKLMAEKQELLQKYRDVQDPDERAAIKKKIDAHQEKILDQKKAMTR